MKKEEVCALIEKIGVDSGYQGVFGRRRALCR